MLTVDTGEGEPLQVVCGAPNARAGMVGVFGGPGTYIPGSDFTLGKATIRGVESNGMMCSARELQLGEDHDGIIELAADAPVGRELRRLSPRSTIRCSTSRSRPTGPDCMGVRGIARDLAAAGAGTLKPLTIEPVAGTVQRAVAVDHRPTRERLPGLLRPLDPRREERAEPRVAAAAAQGRRPAPDLGAGRHHQLCHARPGRPAHAYDIAKLKGGLDRARREGRRGGARAQRQGLCACSPS